MPSQDTLTQGIEKQDGQKVCHVRQNNCNADFEKRRASPGQIGYSCSISEMAGLRAVSAYVQ